LIIGHIGMAQQQQAAQWKTSFKATHHPMYRAAMHTTNCIVVAIHALASEGNEKQARFIFMRLCDQRLCREEM